MKFHTRALVSAIRRASLVATSAMLFSTPAALAAVGDFNGDGIGDVAIGIPNESIVSGGINRASAGAVNVIYGSANNGLVGAQAGTPTSQLWHQDVTGIGDVVEGGDRFGDGVATGDFNGDGFADLAVAVRGDNAIQIINGSAAGLIADGSRVILASQIDDANGRALTIGGNALAATGTSLATGDFNGDGVDDIAIEGRELGAAGSNELEVSKVVVLYGTAGSGLSLAGIDLFTFANNQQFVGEGDLFGVKIALAAGDVDADGDDDLAVGLPFSNLTATNGGSALDGGRVGILLGTPASGLSTAGFRTLLQSTGNAEPVELDDRFGWSLTMGDFNGDGLADLAAGAAFDDRGLNSFFDEGAVSVFSGAATFQSFWTQNVLNQPRDSGDLFGFVLAAADFNGDGRADLAIGQPGDFISQLSGDNAGAVSVIFGGTGGLAIANGVGLQYLAQGNTAAGTSQRDERFGTALSAGNFGRSSHADLLVGTPGETVTTYTREVYSGCGQVLCVRLIPNLQVGAGVVGAVYGSATGFSATGAQAFSQSSGSIPDSAEAGDAFGGTQ